MITYKSPKTHTEFKDYYLFRWEMLRKPLNLPLGSEQDLLEECSHHIAAYKDQTIIGVGRIHIEQEQTARVRYMAVHNNFQGQGIGSSILKELEKFAHTNKLQTCYLYARQKAISFYIKNGYIIKGKCNNELKQLKHERMEKILLNS